MITPPPPRAYLLAPPPPSVPRVLRMLDCELYKNYFLVKFYTPETRQFHKFVLNAWTPLDRAGLVRMLLTSTIVTFNGIRYDVPVMACALAGFNNEQLKKVSNFIFSRDHVQPFQIEQQFNVTMLDYLDHIDLIEVLPGKASLKMYGGKNHAQKMQDLPIDPDAFLTPQEMDIIDNYCGNDLIVTYGQYLKFKTEIDLRVEMSAEYDIDLRSKSDAQIAEAIFKKQIGRKIYPPDIPSGTSFNYKLPAFIQFKTPQLQRMLTTMCTLPFYVNPSGGSSAHIDNLLIDWGDKQVRLNAQGRWITRPKGWQCELITIGNHQYQMGTGGLHSCEQKVSHVADANFSLKDVDVVSYYPRIIEILRLFPPQIGEMFLTTFVGWKNDRVAAKKAGLKKKANGAKTKINGTFGKTGSKYSIIFAPSLLIQTTITGQLSLLMLIELLHLAGIEVVSANTDGVVIKCPRHLHGLRDLIVSHWESITGFETEAVEYRALFSRDVNNYLAFKYDGDVKRKGAFAPPEPVGPSWPNPANEICVLAVMAYILDGKSIERTIRECVDIRQFVTVRNVKGGGAWHPSDVADPVYLGKAVRWYYANNCELASINYTGNGNRVARSEGAKPCMELPDILPPDINYGWYVAEATSLLSDLACC